MKIIRFGVVSYDGSTDHLTISNFDFDPEFEGEVFSSVAAIEAIINKLQEVKTAVLGKEKEKLYEISKET